MKIFEVIPQLSQGGAERFVVDLSNDLGRRHDVSLIVLHNVSDDSFLLNELSPDVRLIIMDKKKGADLSVVRRLNSLIRKEKPDVVHSHLRAILYLAMASVACPETKFLHTVHSDAEKEAEGGISLLVRRILFRRRVTPVTISKMSRKSFDDFYGYDNHLIFNGATPYVRSVKYSEAEGTLSRLRNDDSTKIVLNVARINSSKNQLALVDAVENVRKRGYDLQLVILGDAQNQEITAKIKGYGYSFVHLPGSRSNPRDYMESADCFCLSSVNEGMPISLIECFSVGAVPICTPVGGVVDVINDGMNGILAEGTGARHIEEALLRFLEMDKGQIDAMKRASLETYEHYSMETCSANYELMMSRICAK